MARNFSSFHLWEIVIIRSSLFLKQRALQIVKAWVEQIDDWHLIGERISGYFWRNKTRQTAFGEQIPICHFYGRPGCVKITLDKEPYDPGLWRFWLSICFSYGLGQITLSFCNFLMLDCRIIRLNWSSWGSWKFYDFLTLPISSGRFIVHWWDPQGNKPPPPPPNTHCSHSNSHWHHL